MREKRKLFTCTFARCLHVLTSGMRTMSLSRRLNAAFVLLIVAPTLITTLLLGMRMYRAIESGAVEASAASVEQVRRTMDMAIADCNRELRNAATRLDFLKAVRAYSRLAGRSGADAQNQRAVFTNAMMALSMSLHKRIATEITNEGGMMARLDYRITDEDPERSAIYQESMASDQFINWFSTRPMEYRGFGDAYLRTRPDASAIIVTVKLRDYIDGDVLALMSVALEETFLSELYADTPSADGTVLLILDAEGRIISSADKAQLLREADAAVVQGIRQSGASGGHFTAGGIAERELITFSTSELTGWRVVSVSQYREMMVGLYRFVPAVLLIIVLCLALALVLAMLVSRSVTAPLLRIMRAMDRVKRDSDFGVRIDDAGDDELHVLGQRFNDMVAHTGGLIDEISRAEKELRQAEFQALESQINPHFLYNTLDTISWMAFNSGARDIAQITGSLSRLYRLTLNKGSEKCLVSQEVEHVRHFLAIYFTSHPARIQVHYELDEQALGLTTLKLLLQPLVENAIFHGLEPAGGRGNLWVHIYAQQDELMMEVKDDGVGVGESPPASKGYGIHNIDTRVKLYFGDHYGLRLMARPGGGTIAQIVQPAASFWEVDGDGR